MYVQPVLAALAGSGSGRCAPTGTMYSSGDFSFTRVGFAIGRGGRGSRSLYAGDLAEQGDAGQSDC